MILNRLPRKKRLSHADTILPIQVRLFKLLYIYMYDAYTQIVS